MAITGEAVYENGVLKPAQPLPLKEHEKVQVIVEQKQPSLAERIVARARALLQETLDRLPADGASAPGESERPDSDFMDLCFSTAIHPPNGRRSASTDSSLASDRSVSDRRGRE